MECQVCGGRTSRLHVLKDREVVKCQSCGIAQVSDPERLEELEKAEREYHADKARAYERRPHWEIEVETIADLAPHGGKVLDVGCSDGTFLSMLGDNWQKYGVEIDPERAELARSRGIEVWTGSILDLECEMGFNLITLYEVIEHLLRPREALLNVKKLLLLRGLLVVSTPDAESALAKLRGSAWWSYSYPPHVFFFGHSSFEKLARDLGFHPVLKRFGLHGSPLRGEKGKKIESLASTSRMMARSPLGDRMFYYLKKD